MENIVVIEFGTYIAAPLVTWHLQSAGAKVTSIKRPKHARGYQQEAVWSPYMTEFLQSGKNIIEIDLKKNPERAWDLIKKADVIVENFRPGILNNLGFSAKKCRQVKPSLIYLSLPGFASTDKDLAHLPAWESIIMASSGVFRDMGINRQLMHIPASYSHLPLASVYGSVYGALSIMASLYRDKYLISINCKPLGDTIEVPLASALMDSLVHNSLQFPIPDMYLSKRTRFLRQNKDSILDYHSVLALTDPFYSHYICSDNRPFYIVAPSHLIHQQRALELLEISEDIAKLGIPIADPYANNNLNKYGLGGAHTGDQWNSTLRHLMKIAFLKNTSFEWEKRFGEYGVPGVAHRTTCEWIQSEHAKKAGLIEFQSDTIRPCPIFWTEKSEPTMSSRSRKPINPRFWLDGITVLDLANVIAGPTIGSMLHRFGARVIKIDIPRPVYSPHITIIYGVLANIGKESVLLDISTEAGRAAFEKLLKQIDVIIVNSTGNSLSRLNLTINDLKKITPDIILMQFDAWGGPNANMGNLSQYIGYDDNVQAGTGIMARFGGGLQTVEEHAHVGTIDVIAGVAGALAVVNALIQRLSSGKCIHAHTSLAALSQFIQLPFICGPIDFITSREEEILSYSGIQCKGEHSLHMCYETSDKEWVILVASLIHPSHQYFDENSYINLNTILSIDLRKLSETERYEQLTKFFINHRASFLLKIFKLNNISACLLKSMQELRYQYNRESIDLQGPSYQFITDITHPIGPLTMFCPISIRSTTKLNIYETSAPKYGQDTVKICEEYGIDYKPLIATNIASQRWSDNYLPYSNECPICMQCVHNKITLICGHTICHFCFFSFNSNSKTNCLICNKMDISKGQIITNQKANWKNSYRAWRSGKAFGSKNELASLNKIQFDQKDILHLKGCGDLICYKY